MSATGVEGAQTRQRPRWEADPSTRHRHLRQTCANLYHQRSWTKFHRILPYSSFSKEIGRKRENMLRSESLSRSWMDVPGGLWTLGRIHVQVEGHSKIRCLPPELVL